MGSYRELFGSRDPEILLSGPAGTGKTTAALNYIYYLAHEYPGCRILIARKTRESMTESILKTWEQNVVPEGHPMLGGADRKTRSRYDIGNKSEVIISGLRQSGKDMTQKVMSTDYDFIYIPEAIELHLDEWDKLVSRKRNYKAPFQQLIADTNPSHPNHWLKKRCDAGKCRMIETRHQDNPAWYDHDKQEWTKNGLEYLSILDMMEGAQKLRLRHGRWVQAEGVVYESFDSALHVVTDFEIPKDWKRIRAIDFGYQDPFVCLWIAQDPSTKRLVVYREYVAVNKIVEDHAARIRELEDSGEVISFTVCDHDAGDRATIERHLKCHTHAANKKEIRMGIQGVQDQLRVREWGPSLVFFESLKLTYDPKMEERKMPCGILNEIDSYVWDSSPLVGIKDKPVDKHNHSLDALRYGVMHFRDSSHVWIPPGKIEVKKKTFILGQPSMNDRTMQNLPWLNKRS